MSYEPTPEEIAAECAKIKAEGIERMKLVSDEKARKHRSRFRMPRVHRMVVAPGFGER